MAYTKVALLPEGYKADNGVHILKMDVAVGDRAEFSTELYVRGHCNFGPSEGWHFAGTTTIREGRDEPEADLDLNAKCRPERLSALVIAIHEALDAHSQIAAEEMARICE